ncbi:MAG: SulP family inorganic anion transporter [Actinomycetes bacterium]
MARHRALPVLQGIRPIQTSRLSTELIAGATLAALGIPEVLGYAKIAGMPVVTGLYTLLFPLVIFAILGSSRHLVVGADSATAAILAAGLSGLAVVGSAHWVTLAAIVAIVTGVVLIIARLIRLGFLADFLSRSVLIGFLTGVGIQVAFSQVGSMVGVSSPERNAAGALFHTLSHLNEAHAPTVAVSTGVVVVIVGSRFISRRIPGALLAVVGTIILSWAIGLSAHGVSILGTVPSGFPGFSVPTSSWNAVPTLIGTVGAIALVILAQSSATSRAYATRYEEAFDENVDLVGLGVANLAAGVTGSFVVNGSPTKTQMVDSAGGRSQLAQLSTAAIVLVVLLFFTGPLRYLPEAALASVVFLIGIELVDLPGMRGIWKVRRDEFLIAAATVVVVGGVGVKEGVILAVVLSLLDYVRRGYRPSRSVLARNERGHLHSHPVESAAEASPGLIIYRFAADLFYANTNSFATDVIALADRIPGGWLCIDASAIADIDYSGSRALLRLEDQISKRNVRLVIADLIHPVHVELTRYGILEGLDDDAIYDTLLDVIEAREAMLGKGSAAT